MSRSGGGTSMWCPQCESIRVCRAIPGAEVTWDTDDYIQRRYHITHSDLNWFQRGRECLTCKHRFLTGEIDLEFLFELVRLRNALSDIKIHAERYSSESAKAASSLKKLSASLRVLKALDMYKDIK